MTISTSDLSATADALIDQARALGFDEAALADPAGIGDVSDHLAAFLERHWHGDMDWLARNPDRRGNPAVLWPAVRSVLVVGLNYGPARSPLEALEHTERGAISCYAKNRDYHDVMKKRLKKLGRWFSREYGAEVKVFVDTAPVAEKPLAQSAGLGWQGKHTNLVSRAYGSWLFLGAMYTDMPLPPSTREPDHCGACSACLDICPTNAFPAPYKLDARRCISYLTIEHKGPIPVELRAGIGNRIYGCDDCLAVCPWNKFARTAHEAAFHPRAELDAPKLADLAMLDDDAFRELFAGSPIKRTGRDRFVRNVLIAIGNSGERPLAAVCKARLVDDSALVRGAAVWALRQLVDTDEFTKVRRAHRPAEPDPVVADEWGER